VTNSSRVLGDEFKHSLTDQYSKSLGQLNNHSWEPVRFKTVFSNLSIYGFSHAVVDAASIAVVLSLSQIHNLDLDVFFALVLLYNVLAFGFQVPVGLIMDKWHVPVFSAIAGCVLVAASTTVLVFPSIFAVCLAGVGNALFHVGGGTISLNLTPKRAAAPGIFVAPGAFGVLVGTMIGKNGYFTIWPFVVLLLSLCVVMFVAEVPKIDYDQKNGQESRRVDFRFFELIILLLLSSIAIRSFVGFALVFSWKSDIVLLVTLTVAVVLGKALGGVLADKSGWIRVGIISLLVSAPLLSFGANIPYVAIFGMFSFNITMPITLTAISNMLPGRPGFSFGLTCLALIGGALPTFAESVTVFANQWVILVIILVSTAALLCGLLLFFRSFSFRNSKTYMKRRGGENCAQK
jgi:FSR family fosmidomycin resistance protein-like MFS transporter